MLFSIAEHLTGQVIYLDADLIVHLDIAQLLNISLGAGIAGGVSWDNLCTSRDKALFVDLGIDLNKPHYNTGVMLINCEPWRDKEVTERAISLRRKWDGRLIGGDQPILNAVLVDQFVSLPRRFNTPVSPHRVALSAEQRAEERVWHLVGRPKPWDYLGEWLNAHSPLYLEELQRTDLAEYRSWKRGSGARVRTVWRYGNRYLRCLRQRCFRK